MTALRDYLSLGVMLAVGFAVLSGCASLGYKKEARQQLQQASFAMDQARDAGAIVYAKAELAEAETAYNGANTLFSQKNYDEARKLAATATKKAQRAAEAANANKAKRKDDKGKQKANLK